MPTMCMWLPTLPLNFVFCVCVLMRGIFFSVPLVRRGVRTKEQLFGRTAQDLTRQFIDSSGLDVYFVCIECELSLNLL